MLRAALERRIKALTDAELGQKHSIRCSTRSPKSAVSSRQTNAGT
jgi:hypothetical protein